ncbi:hypothetical protein EBB07_11695 [Paenibacillaceae bacterium]|nr:hypothetical protein EBB07_11695 [Paenibacillaceae bacterium]
MMYSFIIDPSSYTPLDNEDALIDKCKEWGLLSEKASKTKAFFYKGRGLNLACSIIGYVDNMTAVISFENDQKHCIHPSYLKEMQASAFNQKPSAMDEWLESNPDQEEASGQEHHEHSEALPPASGEEIVVEDVQEPKPAAPKAAPKPKAAKEKTKKLQLPEAKVKMSAAVKEFATVPNHFADNDDEVIIYEAVTIMDEPEMALGLAWSSHSATLKKHELEVGDLITFEAKVVQKKLTKHPVPYKINNPAKIQKENS